MQNDLGTVEILEAQVALLERLASQAFATKIRQATISKRQLLNFVNEVEEFARDFLALNERTINMIRSTQNGKESNEGAQLDQRGADTVGDPASRKA